MTVRYPIAGRNAAEISATVEAGVRAGALAPGDALPPVRQLAAELGVSPATVASAYRSLRQRGVIETAGRHGSRIRPRPPVAWSRATRAEVPAGVVDLSRGEPDARLLPDLGPHLAELARATTTAASYGAAGTVPELATVARDRLAADGVPADALTLTTGALDGIERLLGARLRPGDRVAVEDPGWANLLDLIAALGLTPVPVPVDEDGPTVAGLRRALAVGVGAAIITARAQNPTGAAVGGERAESLRTLLRGHPDLLLIEDDHSAELSGVPLRPLAGATRHWAFVRSVSKPYGPDLRLAVLAGDEATVARVAGRMRAGAGWVSLLLQRLVLALWRDPAVAAGLAAARDSYERRRTGLRAALAERGVTAYGRTGSNLWLPVRDETAAVTGLREAGYAVAPGAPFRLAAPPGVRVTVSPLAPTDLPTCAADFAAALTTRPGGPRAV